MMAEKKPMARHRKMYAGSPRIDSDADGKKVIKKGPTDAEKAESSVGAGIDGIQTHPEATDLGHRHAKEHLELKQKHEREFLEFAQKSGGTNAEPSDPASTPHSEGE